MKPILFALAFGALFLSFSSKFGNNHYKGGQLSDTTHFIGEYYVGGIIFFLSDDGKHGLIVAKPEHRKLLSWSNGKNKITGTTEEERKYKGIENTVSIVNLLTGDNPTGNFAAKACIDFSTIVEGNTYDDWYLPSKQELNLLFQNNKKIGDFDERYYWSSNEASSEEAWVQSFYDGRQLRIEKSDENYVIAIRSF